MAAKKIQKPNLEDFCIDGFFLFIEKSNHLNRQVTRETAQFRLQRETFFKTDLQAPMNSKLQTNGTTYRFYIQGVSFQGGRHFCDFLLQSLDRKKKKKQKRCSVTMETTVCRYQVCVGCCRSHTPASSLLPDIWLPGWWSSWAEAGFPCLWLALHPQTLCTSYWTGGLRETGQTPTTHQVMTFSLNHIQIIQIDRNRIRCFKFYAEILVD